MNPKRQEKLEHQLQSLENELVSDLLAHLPSASETGSDLFLISRWNSNNTLVEQLRNKSETCCELRNTLALNSHDSPAALYLLAHNEASDLDNQHRRGPRKLAQSLLQQIEAYNAV